MPTVASRGGTAYRLSVVFMAALASGCDDFSLAPELASAPAQGAASPWPTAVFVQDTVELAVELAGGTVTGADIEWTSSDPTILELVDVSPAGMTREAELASRLLKRAIAHRRGQAEITVSVAQGGLTADTTVVGTVTVQEHWTAVSAGADHSCGVTIDDHVYCWGDGLIGDRGASGSPIPVRITGVAEALAVTAGGGQRGLPSQGHTCALPPAGDVQCWGYNGFGAVGSRFPDDELAPTPVVFGQTFSSVVAGRGIVCGITDDSGGETFCWGDNRSWQIGDAYVLAGEPYPPFDDSCHFTSRCALTPRRVQDATTQAVHLTVVAPAVFHVCGLRPSGQAVCWGTGSAEIGSATYLTDATVPTPFVDVLSPTLDTIVAGASHNCGLTEAGETHCWGLNSHGQLGTANPGFSCPSGTSMVPCSPVPLMISAPAFRQISAGGQSTCGVTMNGDVYCWGSNEFAQLGAPGAPDMCGGVACSLDPMRVPIPDRPPVASVAVGDAHACAVTRSGAAWCWGNPTSGRLGSADAPTTGTGEEPLRVSEPAGDS